MSSYAHVREHKVIGICKTNKKWVNMQYRDQWGDEVSFYVPVEDWKKMGRPYIGATIHIEVQVYE